MVDTPSPPDPTATANAQTASNIATANATQETNVVNQNTPYGSLTYTQNGTNPDGTSNYTANTTLSPQLQNLVDSNLQGAQGESNTENQLLNNVSSTLSQPVNLGESADEQRLDQLALGSVLPQQQQATAQSQQQLYDQGLRPGDEAYNNVSNNLAQQQNQQLNDLYLQGHNTATSDALQQYNEPLNALSALRSGSQVSQPGINAATTPTTSVAGTNTAGIAQQDYADQLSASNAAMGGLFGLGGTLGGAAMLKYSDERLKEDIERVGELDNGLGVYSYRYRDGGPPEIGLIAQDVEKVNPDAVREIGGFKAVDYAKAASPSGGLFGLGGSLKRSA